MKLIIVESPNKCHTISSIMGSGYSVMATAGHIMQIKDELAYNTGIDVKNGFTILSEFDPAKKDRLKEIKAAAKNADEIFVCSDGDREGESIANEIRTLLKTEKKKLKRAIFNEITPKAVKNAIANPIPFDENLIAAAETRQIIDRLIGFRVSPVSKQIGCESAGRVQSALLQFICKKERDIQAFKSAKYFDVFADAKSGRTAVSFKLDSISGKKVTKIADKKIADECVSKCNGKDLTISDIKKKKKSIAPKLPMTSATLQQIASNVLGFSPNKTMAAAQHLFEKAYITYHRTDAIRFSDEFIDAAKANLNANHKGMYAGLNIPKEANEDAQNGHESIRPTDLANTPDKISGLMEHAEYKLYELIYNHTLASFCKPAEVEETDVYTENGKYSFKTSGKVITKASFLEFYNHDIDEEALPEMKKGDVLKKAKVYAEEKETLPPPRYSEAGLVKLMKDTGIGRPSTYASAIETLKKREYITVEKKAVHATDKGMKLDKMISDYFLSVINAEYTANMESDLDLIASGKKEKLDKLNEFWGDFEPVVLSAAKTIKANRPAPTVYEGAVCPDCGAPLYIRESKYGKFAACSRYPRCKYSASIGPDGKLVVKEKKPAPVDTGKKCPKCGKGHLVERTKGSTGEKFYACKRFPKCNFTMSQAKFNEEFKD